MASGKYFLPKGTLVPNHLAIIPDGNRRWARARNLPAFEGHRRGFDITPEIARACRDFGIHTLTIWAFSTENWDRSRQEIAFLMKKYEDFVDQHLKEAKKEGVRIFHLGRKDRIPESLLERLNNAEKETQNNSKYILNIALDYGGKDEILRATLKMFTQNPESKTLDEEIYKKYLDTNDQPYPEVDLVIRSSGEQRFSGLMSWQAAYAEFFWLTDHFPEFTPEKLKEIILDYSRRRRRFGGNDLVPKVSFGPKKVARLEISWWQAHNEKNNQKLFKFLMEWLKELYGLKTKVTQEATELLRKGVLAHNQKDWQKAVDLVGKFYDLIKKETNYVFEPVAVAELEVNWWQIHDQLENDLDKERLEKAFCDYYGEIYRLSGLQAAKIAHFKALATQAHDLAESSLSEKDQEKYWQQAEEFLLKAYQSLRQAAS